MRRRSGRGAAVLLALFLAAPLGGCSASAKPHGPRELAATDGEPEQSVDEILSAPYEDEAARDPESMEEKAGGLMVSTILVGAIIAIAVAPLIFLGPLGLF